MTSGNRRDAGPFSSQKGETLLRSHGLSATIRVRVGGLPLHLTKKLSQGPEAVDHTFYVSHMVWEAELCRPNQRRSSSSTEGTAASGAKLSLASSRPLRAPNMGERIISTLFAFALTVTILSKAALASRSSVIHSTEFNGKRRKQFFASSPSCRRAHKNVARQTT
jgi:hypothetical protein